MLPVIALIGRANVGKSTLFNRLTRGRDALVDDQPGVTRDRLYGRGSHDRRAFLVVDSGGLTLEAELFAQLIRAQVDLLLEEADQVWFLVDARAGLTPPDQQIAEQLRRKHSAVTVVVNKAEGLQRALAVADFQALGLGHPRAISAKRGDGVADLLTAQLPISTAETPPADPSTPRVAVVGRPNVGKSTLINQLVGACRLLVSAEPGTTRDSVRVPLQFLDKPYVLIDTAGMRRRARVTQTLEKFSSIKTLQAIEDSHVVLLVLDGACALSAQDASIAGMVQDLGKSVVLVVNKWDCLNASQRRAIKGELSVKLPFLPQPEVLYISALHAQRLHTVMPAAQRAYAAAMVSLATASLNRSLQAAVTRTPPPLHHGRAVRLKFAHQSGKNPPVIVVHGNQVEQLPHSYRRYLAGFFSRQYALVGTPLRIIPRNSRNPFADKGSSKRPGRAAARPNTKHS